MKPWTNRKQIAAALRHEGIAIGSRTLANGQALRGIYATRSFAVGDCVASYQGTTLSTKELFALHDVDKMRFDFLSDYAVESPGGFLYSDDLDTPGAHLINHACGPNAQWAEREQGALLVRAFRPIAEGEEITIHYGWLGLKSAYEDRRHPCACTSSYCAGFIELYVELVRDEEGAPLGPSLPVYEIARRYAADIVNDTTCNEGTVLRYAREGFQQIRGGPDYQTAEPVDVHAFMAKVREGARAAVEAVRTLRSQGISVSEKRLRNVAAFLDVTRFMQSY